MPDYYKHFAETGLYEDEASQGQTCYNIMPEGVVPGVSLGYNFLTGPWHVGREHYNWDQIFVVVKGHGVLELGDERLALEPETIVLIPAFTDHDTFVEQGEKLEYVYVNKARQ